MGRQPVYEIFGSELRLTIYAGPAGGRVGVVERADHPRRPVRALRREHRGRRVQRRYAARPGGGALPRESRGRLVEGVGTDGAAALDALRARRLGARRRGGAGLVRRRPRGWRTRPTTLAGTSARAATGSACGCCRTPCLWRGTTIRRRWCRTSCGTVSRRTVIRGRGWARPGVRSPRGRWRAGVRR